MSDKQAIAIVGTGYWGRNLVRNFLELGVLGAICDTDAEALARIAEAHPDAPPAVPFDDVLSNPAIEGVVIATPAATHAELARKAILAGKHVYVEKPLCLTEQDGRELLELAGERKRTLMVGHLLWYHPAILKLKDLIDRGELGRILHIASTRLNLGKIRREENVLWSFAPHDISVVMGLLGETPESVQVHGGHYLNHRVADTTNAVLSFASGVHAYVYVSWLHPYKEQRLVVVGDRKMAVFEDTAAWPQKLWLYPQPIQWKGTVPNIVKNEAEYLELTPDEPLKLECQHFLECLKTGRTPRTDGAEGLRVLSVLNACQRSMETRMPTRLTHRAAPAANYFVHESAVVDEGANIGEGTRIWHFSHVLPDTVLGKGCSVGQNVVIGPHVQVGDNCKIQNNVSVYEGVTLEDDVFCGPSMVFTNVINPRSHVSRKHEFKKTLVKKGATIGANATILCGYSLGQYAFVAAGAVVTRDVRDYALVMGNPAREVGWMCACGERLPDTLHCKACGQSYQEDSGGLEPVVKSAPAVENGASRTTSR